jgi:hypothetical protein
MVALAARKIRLNQYSWVRLKIAPLRQATSNPAGATFSNASYVRAHQILVLRYDAPNRSISILEHISNILSLFRSTSQMDAARLYASLPLPSNSNYIRVLDIHSPSFSDDWGLIKGSLRIVDLDDPCKRPFAALSYVWGPYAIKKHTIVYDTGELEITANCHSALLHLRKAFGSYTVWVDAICIDQTNDAEKVHQIPLMGHIYSLASSVYIWLGEGSHESDKAMDNLAAAGFLEYFLEKDEFDKDRPSIKARKWAAVWAAWRTSWNFVDNRFVRDSTSVLYICAIY